MARCPGSNVYYGPESDHMNRGNVSPTAAIYIVTANSEFLSVNILIYFIDRPPPDNTRGHVTVV